MRKTFIFLAVTYLFLSGLQSANAQGIFGKIKDKAKEAAKPITATSTGANTNPIQKSGSANVRDVFREAAPLLQITASENVDKVISQTFESENRIIFKVPANLGISTEGTMRYDGEAKIFPTKSGGSLFAVTYTGCTPANICDNQFQLIQIENDQPQLVTGSHLATIYTPNNMVAELLKADKNYKKPMPANLKPNINFAGDKLNMVVDCADGVCQNAFVIRSFSFDGEKFVETK